MQDALEGLPDELREALERAPADEKALLELALDWPALEGAEARVAERLRTFVLTCDPLGWLPDRKLGWATAGGEGDDYEVVLYLTLEGMLRTAGAMNGRVVDVLARLAGSVVVVGARHEHLLEAGADAELDASGDVPVLLAEAARRPGLEQPSIRLAAAGWEPIGLGAIQDLVQEEFGPVDLDRSPVQLTPAAEADPSCPACAGRRFGFPGELLEHGPLLCPEHAVQADAVAAARIGRAEESNAEGWEAIAEASARLSQPFVPDGVRQRLEAAVSRRSRSPDELRADAQLALELAEHFAGRPDDLPDFLAAEDWFFNDWLIELPMALSAAGLVDEAVRVGDAVAELWEDNRSLFASDAAMILASAGRAEEAAEHAAANLRDFPDDLWVRIHAGDAYAAIGDPERAEAAFRTAVEMAAASGEVTDLADASERLSGFLAGRPGREVEARAARRQAEATQLELCGRVVAKIGRNEPCPCGSGRKYKRCCGA